jgi:5-methylcytosine-specific restriction protein A
MPTAPPLACSTVGCGGKRQRGEACDRCGRGGKRAANREYDARRGTRTERGYDNRWLRFAKQYLRANPLCVDCQTEGRVGAASEVHHLEKLSERPDLKYEPSNLAGLCKQHHSKRTSRGE